MDSEADSITEEYRPEDRPNNHVSVFPWYGGKFSHLEFILPRLPVTNQYVEPFGGSAAVLLSREPAPVETYNDIDGDVANFFRVLRDEPDELIRRLERTPYSREEYLEAIEAAGDDSLPDLERARLFYVRAAQVYSGLAQYATPGRWSFSRTSSVRERSNAVAGWQVDVAELDDVADRLRRVQIEHDDALEVIDRYDHEGTTFYCDPPYPLQARGTAGCGTADPVAYSNEMSAEDHRELAEVLADVEGKVAVSSYRNELYDDVFNGWEIAEGPEKTLKTKHDAEPLVRREVLYTNYDPDAVSPSAQSALDGFVGGEA